MNNDWQSQVSAQMHSLTVVVDRIEKSTKRYGKIASSHESLGVITEEYHELIEAVRSNSLADISREAIDIAAACVRLSMACELWTIRDRSTK